MTDNRDEWPELPGRQFAGWLFAPGKGVFSSAKIIEMIEPEMDAGSRNYFLVFAAFTKLINKGCGLSTVLLYSG